MSTKSTVSEKKVSPKKEVSTEESCTEVRRGKSHSSSFVRNQGLPEMAEHLSDKDVKVKMAPKGSWGSSD